MLELKRRSIVELPYEVLEQAHWRPSEAQLCCRYKKPSGDKEFLRLRNHWRRQEVNFNFSLDALLMALCPEELGQLVRSISGLNSEETYLVDGYCAPMKKVIGVPDFVLSDSVNCLLGENKLASSFTLDQFIKYQCYALLCRSQASLPDHHAVVIVVRDPDPRRFISDYGKPWNPCIENGKIVLGLTDEEAIISTMKERFEALIQKKFVSANDIESAMRLFRPVPTYVLNWDEFVKRLALATSRLDLRPALDRLLNIAMGDFEVAIRC